MSFKASAIKRSSCAVLCFLLSLCLYSCAGTAGRSASLLRRCGSALLGNYDSEMTYRVRFGDQVTEGSVNVRKAGSVTRIEINGPEPLSGLCAEYDVTGLPKSVEVHFLGIDTKLPESALAHLTLAFSVISDEAATLLAKTGKKSADAFPFPDSRVGAVTKTNVGGAEVCTVCDEEGNPVSFSLQFENCEVYCEVTSFRAEDPGDE